MATSAESSEYLRSVKEWRGYWRPDKVRGLLIAESHAHEVEGDSICLIRGLGEYGLDNAPESFCRLVYCLGYGENDILTPKPHRKNAGTWQYWDIFGAIAHDGIRHSLSKQPRKGNSTLRTRLNWKIDVLKRLRNRGIWLVDASTTGLYMPGGRGKEKTGKAYTEHIQDCFRSKVLPHLEGDPIEKCWVIGKQVHKAIKPLGLIPLDGVISQPNSREFKDEQLVPLLNSLNELKVD